MGRKRGDNEASRGPNWRPPWINEYGETSPGWALAGFTSLLMAVGLLVLWLNDRHMFGP